MKKYLYAVCAMFAAGIQMASATELYGTTITTAIYRPTYGAIYPTLPNSPPYSVVAGPVNPDLTFFGSARFDIDFQQDQIVIRMDDSGCCTSAAPFNGISFKLASGVFDVANLLYTNIPGFSQARVFLHNSTELLVDLGNGLNLDPPNSTIVIGVSQVPEPSLPLLAFGGLSVIAARSPRNWFRTKRTVD